MMPPEEYLHRSVAYIRDHVRRPPEIGIILGSGLGDYADNLPAATAISTGDIPHYPISTVAGHKGKLVFASVGGKSILAFQGRLHFYETGVITPVLYPILIADKLGIRTLIVTNAAGAVNRSFLPGDLMLITDQINLTTLNATGSSQKALERSHYSSKMIQMARTVASRLGQPVRTGVYAGVKGPSYETAAEVEMIYRIGGDAVGMSTVLEVELASSLGFEVLGISCITNLGTGIGTSKLNHTEVTEVGRRVKASFSTLLSAVVEAL
jgi:purine-nucleoside phosphorylase